MAGPTEPPARPSDAGSAPEELIARIANGDRGALGELYDLTARRLFGLALWRTGNREDAADVVQDVFVRLVRTRADLTRVRDAVAYLMTTTHRIAIDRVRRRRTDDTIDDHPYLEAATGAAEERLQARILAARVDALPPKQREVVYLRDVEGMTFREIGEVTDCSTFTAASRHRLAMRRLRRALEGKR